MSKILILDDEESLTTAVKDILEAQGFLVDVSWEPDLARTMLKVSSYDLLILDWHMPTMSGIEFLTTMRMGGSSLPVLMLTGADTSEEKVRGLETGADDYLTKPFNARELVARVRALLRRPSAIQEEELRAGGVSLNTRTRTVFFQETELSLTKQEYMLLEFLLRHPDTPFNSEVLVEKAWSAMADTSPDTVRVHMYRLRKKLELNGVESPIRTIKGKGYFITSK